MTFACFKRSRKIPYEKDKLTMRERGSESSFSKYLRITGGMLFGRIALFTLKDFISFSISSEFVGCLNKDFSFGFFR